jgi:hypothetical protein
MVCTEKTPKTSILAPTFLFYFLSKGKKNILIFGYVIYYPYIWINI